jgi:DNA (cytosine-5)-methyltransferase 1
MRSAELFSGCGGLALGLARAGFKHELVVERDPQSIETLQENKRQKVSHVRYWPISAIDTRDIDFGDHRGIDLIAGGPPCQPFSIGGRHLGPQDSRNMWPEAVRAVRQIRPKAFIFENVRGLLRPAFAKYLEYTTLQLAYPDIERRHGETWKTHLARLRQHAGSKRGRPADYRVLVRGINTADYGAAQKRHRAIIVGIASKFGDEWEIPAPTHSDEALAWTKYVECDYWDRHETRRLTEPSSAHEEQALRRALDRKKSPSEKPWVTVRDALNDLPSPKKNAAIQGHWQHHGARAYRNHTGSCIDEPAKALKAGDHGVPGGENMLVNSRGNVRYFTIREMARLQGFPDDFIISGSWKAATRQLGNAVPVQVGEKIGKEIIRLLKAKSEK